MWYDFDTHEPYIGGNFVNISVDINKVRVDTVHLITYWFFMVDLWNRADHYIFILSFVLSFFFFSSPNLSRRGLDVCHTSTHGVALVRI